MTVERDFRDRIISVRSYLRSIEELEKSYTANRRVSFQARATVAASRAASFIMLYNCIEFGVRESITEIRLDIQHKGISFVSLQTPWREEIARAHFQDRLRQGTNHENLVRDFAAFVPGKIDWKSEKHKLPFAGNVNEQKLFDLTRKLNVKWRPPRRILSVSNSDLELVRKMRNDLAHGVETFENVGARFSTSDLLDTSARIRDLVASFVRSLEKYRSSGRFELT